MTDGPSLLARTVQALQDSGRLVRTDWETETFDVLPEQDGGEPTAGVVLSATNSVVFYAVWPDTVPPPRREAVAAYTVRANTGLATSAFEFGPATGILSVRAGIEFGDLAETIDGAVLQALLVATLDEVEHVAEEHRTEVAALLGADLP
ncbi:MAG: hypothetical protein EPN43_06525 [Jatrophihabitans sp.]|nr:MAG: hypothetical protein EPN43_06525 [Jatrophihabitans sp.]